MKILVTGGVRSGKSHHAESLLGDERAVTYIATGPDEAAEPDPDWVARLTRHRARRPVHWQTVEADELDVAIRASTGPVLIDCLGTWLTRMIDRHELWDAPVDEVTQLVHEATTKVVGALQRSQLTVLVTNEVGLGIVPAHRSGRLFRDLLGDINRMVAAACDQVHLVIAGKVLKL